MSSDSPTAYVPAPRPERFIRVPPPNLLLCVPGLKTDLPILKIFENEAAIVPGPPNTLNSVGIAAPAISIPKASLGCAFAYKATLLLISDLAWS